VNIDWISHPVWLIVNGLVAFRLARLVVDDALPPLPRVRAALVAWAERRAAREIAEARRADQAAHGKPALVDGEPRIGPHEQAVYDRRQPYDGEPSLVTLISCYWCAGFWTSVATVAGASLLPTTVWSLIAAPLALSAIVGLAAR